ncbi:MAG TPA: GNAT family N-acetyltransferase [Caulifigura sp.]|nr:GNAT family N-acetyltransferase [Caulifigura sp.]
MLTQSTLNVIASYWSSDFDCPVEQLLAQPLHVLTHGPALAGYNGIFALFRDGMATMSFPQSKMTPLTRLLPDPPLTAAGFSNAFDRSGFRIVGPACLNYAEHIAVQHHAVRRLAETDTGAVRSLQEVSDSTEWEHGGIDSGAAASFGVIVGRELVSIAGYELWGNTIAHISVITHPAHRGRGYARSAVAQAATAALEAGLIPQYRTLVSNGPSMSVAQSLGFDHYATSVAVKLGDFEV